MARLEFGRRGAVTDLARLFQQGSLRVLRPNGPAGEPAGVQEIVDFIREAGGLA